jgi:ATP-binding protein involved in chromosome partitioning
MTASHASAPVAPTSAPGDLTAEEVRAALTEVRYPGLPRDIVSLGIVDQVSACGGVVQVRLALRTADASVPEQLQVAVSERVLALGAAEVTVAIGEPRNAAPPRAHGTPDPWADQVRLAAVRHVIAVGAGKGGVGKSTVAVGLALALAREGLRVGLLDADIYGPSLPILLGIADGAAQARMSPEKFILPVEAHGLPFVSFGFFLGEGSPAIWRGPMVSKAVKQFARGVAWPTLDVLVVDLPPGTGDIPLSLAQSVQLSGAVVVTQPARVAAAEAEKAVAMFRTLEVPVLGVVENMTGAFGEGAGAAVAASLAVPFLGAIPFDPAIVTEGDAGTPGIVQRPDASSSRALDAIAAATARALGYAPAPVAAEG